jgi:hypothetical protein
MQQTSVCWKSKPILQEDCSEMAEPLYHEIVQLFLRASELAASLGITNLLQPGLVREMVIADLLGHELIPSKRHADARNPDNPAETYEYLSCKEGGSGQMDRMFKSPDDKRRASLNRITRNSKIYLAVFYEANQAECKIIYELEPDIVAQEAERQLDRSRNVISHLSFSESWARRHGRVVYQT